MDRPTKFSPNQRFQLEATRVAVERQRWLNADQAAAATKGPESFAGCWTNHLGPATLADRFVVRPSTQEHTAAEPTGPATGAATEVAEAAESPQRPLASMERPDSGNWEDTAARKQIDAGMDRLAQQHLRTKQNIGNGSNGVDLVVNFIPAAYWRAATAAAAALRPLYKAAGY